MTPTVPQGSGLISVRSRRLRTVGIVLLVALLAMTVYGMLGLMPSVRRIRDSSALKRPVLSASATPEQRAAARAENRRIRRVMLAQVAFVYGYWSVCGVLAVTALLVAWLDMREVSRNFAAQRRALWTEAAARGQRERPPPS